MSIKKKDGNVYILEGPNKLVKDQEKIDLSKCVFYNFAWDEIVHKGKISSKIPIKSKLEENSTIIFEQIEKSTTKSNQEDPVIIKKEPEPKEDFPKKQEQKQDDFKFPILKVKVLMHCLPAKISSHKDLLYGDSWQRITYGNKFIFPAVMISNNDLQMQFWTSDPNNKVTEKSIVFPFSYEIYNQNTQEYDRIPFDEHRWWKVSIKEEKEGGYLVSTIPSEDHPDFSD